MSIFSQVGGLVLLVIIIIDLSVKGGLCEVTMLSWK